MYLRSSTTPKPGHHPYGDVPFMNAPAPPKVPVAEAKGADMAQAKMESSPEPSPELRAESNAESSANMSAESNVESGGGSGAGFNAGSGVESTPNMPAREKFEAALERTRSAESGASGGARENVS
jgi:hypothetical protein